MNSSGSTHSRIAALDFTKGVLVICMVAYHSLNYSTRPELGFRWLAFLPPSFIVITGFLLGRVYFARPAAQDAATRSRLWMRGAKLLLVFTLLNLATNLVKRSNYNGQPLGLTVFLEHAWDIYVLGNGHYSAFEVLLPIAYLLLLGPLWLWLERRHRLLVPGLAVLAVAACMVWERQGGLWPNLALLSAGLVGVMLGGWRQAPLERLGRYWLGGALLYGAYAAGASFWGQSYFRQLLGSLLALLVICGLGFRAGAAGWVQQRICGIGCYSLISYIGQIALLQILVRLLGRPSPGSVSFAFMFMATLGVMVLAVESINWARGKSGAVDLTYRSVFG